MHNDGGDMDLQRRRLYMGALRLVWGFVGLSWPTHLAAVLACGLYAVSRWTPVLSMASM